MHTNRRGIEKSLHMTNTASAIQLSKNLSCHLCSVRSQVCLHNLQLSYSKLSRSSYFSQASLLTVFAHTAHGVKWNWTPWGRGYNWSIWCEMKLDTMGEGLQLVYNVDQLINCQTMSLFSSRFRVGGELRKMLQRIFWSTMCLGIDKKCSTDSEKYRVRVLSMSHTFWPGCVRSVIP